MVRPIRITHWKLGRIGKASQEPDSAPPVRRRRLGFRAEPAWSLLSVFGWTLMLVGGIELGLAVYPIERSPEWEFATAVTLVSGLPVPLMGLALVLASALKRRARLTARIAGTLCLLGAAGMLGGLVIFGLTIPVALRFINEPIVREGLMKAIFKTSSQGVVYAVALSVMGYQGWRRAKSASHTEETRDDSVTASS